MRPILRPTALCLSTLLPAPLLAQEPPRVMMCQIADESGTGWVPDFIMLTRQVSGPQQGRIEVFDPILKDQVGRPIQAQLVADDARARSYGWALAGVRNQSGQRTERLDFRLTVSKRDGAAEVVVTALGYDNVMIGRGVCGAPPDR
ncbi:hypothetical protein [Paracoccus aminovorans]|uniref:hypothetical protein n=1 Tax=Paracoccus aminovorans TaxID=34004 RepID=UPI0007811D8B|nr:hypothetical protein [Paracoccus aminovorans]MDQ7775095.1 hypothetical protein [Paracoccus aminovorans]MDQ7776459.1 hypothetical protein [Paracoccus aminovorans]